MKFFNNIPTINGYDTETYENNLKVICDAYGKFYEYDNNPDHLLNWLFSTKCDLNFLYNLDYDASIIFVAIMPEADPNNTGIYHYKNYDIYYISNKSLIIKKHISKTRTEILRLYDIAQFYKNEKGYQPLDKVAKDVLGYGKNSDELEIKREDIGQIKGYYEQHRDKIIKYCINDAYLTLELAKKKISSILPILNNQIPKVYNSSASISKAYLSIYHNDLKYAYFNLLSKLDNWKDAVRIIENCYSGGIFYLHSLGKVENVYEYDINSAYPYAITQLFSLKDAEIRYTDKYMQSDYGFYYVRIRNLSNLPIRYRTGETEITYIKNNDYVENYFTGIELEYFLDHHQKDIQFEVIKGIVINTTKKLEFEDYKELYDMRNKIKQSMKEKKALERVNGENLNSLDEDMKQWSYKTILNASYGVFAERKNGYTAFTNLIYASYITAMTRLKIYSIIDKLGWEHIKAIMTDAVITDVEINDNEFNSNELGSFKLEGKFDQLWLYQNGIYVSKIGNKITLHNRGFPSLTDPNLLFKAKGTKLRIERKNKIIKIKEGIIQHRENEIGKFTTQSKIMDLEANRWKYMLDVEKLNFQYLRDNELETDYLFNIDLQFEYTERPYEKRIDYRAIKDMIYQSKHYKLQRTKTYVINKIQYEDLIEKAVNGINAKRDLKRIYNKYKKNLDADFVALDHYSHEHKISEAELENGLLRFNGLIVDMTQFM